MGNINQERCQEQDRVITVAKRDTSPASAHNHATRTPARARAAERARPRLATTAAKKDTSPASSPQPRNESSGKGGGGGADNRSCYNCGEFGHISRDCTAQKKPAGVCFAFQRGDCQYGDTCKFSHVAEE